MKTKRMLKSFIILIAMVLIFCGGVSAQNYEISFLNDSGSWVSGLQPIAIPHSNTNYRSPSISGVGGDTIYAKLLDDSSDVVNVDYWIIDNQNPPYTNDTIWYSDTIAYILPSNTSTFIGNPITITAYIVGADVEYAVVYPKFLPPSLLLGGSSKSQTDTLTLADFSIYVNVSGGGTSARCDSVYWYLDGLLIHTGTDTSFIAYASGDYSIQAKIVYVTNLMLDTCIHERWQSSNKVTVVIDGVYVESVPNKTTFKIYPNPVTTCLYISEKTSFSVFSISGEEVIKGVGNKVDVSNMKPGIYILRTLKGDAKFIIN